MKVIITINIEYASDVAAVLFNARSNYLSVNQGNHQGVSVSIKAGIDYLLNFGETERYSEFLADCFRYPLRINSINGKEVNIDPFKKEYITKERTLIVELTTPN